MFLLVTEELLLCIDWEKTVEAMDLFGWTFKEFPNDPFFLELKGQISFEAGKILLAITYFRQAFKNLPHAQVIPIFLSQALLENPNLKNNDLKEAIGYLNECSKHSPDSTFTWRLLAQAYGKNNQMDYMALCLAEEGLLINDFAYG